VQNELDNGLEDREYYMSISEIADVIGISKQRVRQIEQRALLKIKKALAEFV
jgi:DNA-directed RNA polymerase sigma subunit (sigma70/sigma32)